MEKYLKAKEINDRILRGDLLIGIMDISEVNEMIQLYKEAISENSAEAAYDFAIVYLTGEVVEKSYSESLNYFKKALELNYGNHAGIMYLKTAYFNNINSITLHDLNYVFNKLENDNTGEVELLKGYMLYKGFIFEKNDEKSLLEHIKAAEKGNSNAMFELSVYYAQGIGSSINEEKSIIWCKKAAEKGNTRAIYNLGAYYCTGTMGFSKDINKGAEWYKKAADLGHAKACAQLAVMFCTGDEGFEKNESEAKKYYDLAWNYGFDVDYYFESFGLIPYPLPS